MDIELEIVNVPTRIEEYGDVYDTIATVPGSTGPYLGPLPVDRLRYVDKPGELDVSGVRYGYPSRSIFLSLKPLAGAPAPQRGDRLKGAV